MIVPSQQLKPPYDPLKDFVPVAKVGIIPLVLAVSPTVPISSVKELVAYAKANPGKLSYASSGAGTISQQEMELFKQAAGLNIVEVGYKSTSQAMTDVLGGQIELFPVVVPLVMPHLKSGRVRALGLFDTQRSAVFRRFRSSPEELGVPGYAHPGLVGFMAPVGTPSEAVATLNGLFHSAMQSAEVKERLTGLGAQPYTPTNEQFATELKAEFDKAAKVAKMLGTAK